PTKNDYHFKYYRKDPYQCTDKVFSNQIEVVDRCRLADCLILSTSSPCFHCPSLDYEIGLSLDALFGKIK
ncbi:MAG: hypothetical protein NTX36_10550, partial [Proteobacteria bacterium]|nr:hypothetical protein [Pseudomonadota bacterium]